MVSPSSSTMLRTAKTAIRFQWASHKIDNFVSTLDRLRSSLNLATVLAFRKNSEDSNAEVRLHLMEIQPNGRSQTLHTAKMQTMIDLISDDMRQHTNETLKNIQDQNLACLDEITALHHKIAQTEESIGREEILKLLDFRQVLWRYHAVEQAYDTTYEWNFQSPPALDK